ncbi:MAG: hypothetical protein ACYDD2_10985 [Candidatus Acidiferrales bacterium]
MNAGEFNVGVLKTEDDSKVTLDVRPFGQRQGEAIDSYLHDVGMALQMNAFRQTKPIVVVCDSGTIFPATTKTWLAEVRRRGVDVAVQSVDK